MSSASQGCPAANAAVDASTPKCPTLQWVSGGKPAAPAAVRGEPVTTIAHFSPARFQALLADTSAYETSPAPGTVKIGVTRVPGKASGAWISSLKTVAPAVAAASTRARSSDSEWAVPTGFCG